MLCLLSLVEIGPMVLMKKTKMWIVYKNGDDDNNNDDGQRTNFDQKSSLELKSFDYRHIHFNDYLTSIKIATQGTALYS